ncbi:hypothetical protein RSAG8_01176, partial [Rhizoctonia solani AG-8 WAC10335]
MAMKSGYTAARKQSQRSTHPTRASLPNEQPLPTQTMFQLPLRSLRHTLCLPHHTQPHHSVVVRGRTRIQGYTIRLRIVGCLRILSVGDAAGGTQTGDERALFGNPGAQGTREVRQGSNTLLNRTQKPARRRSPISPSFYSFFLRVISLSDFTRWVYNLRFVFVAYILSFTSSSCLSCFRF